MAELQTVVPPASSAPQTAVPAGTCDTHTHVFGPFGDFPPLRASVYPLPTAGPAEHAGVRAKLGMDRAVLVQPAPYANDPSAMLAAIAGAGGALRGIAVADPDIDEATLDRWVQGGIRGLRFVDMPAPGGGRYPGSVGFDALLLLADRMRSRGLHAQLWGRMDQLAAALPDLARLGVPLVVDHMGCPAAGSNPASPDVARVLELMNSGAVWMKLALCRVGAAQDRYAGVRDLHDAFVAAAPSRCLWGSDWPYVRLEPAPDAGKLLDLFQQWVPDADVRRGILVGNPARLYGFGVESQ